MSTFLSLGFFLFFSFLCYSECGAISLHLTITISSLQSVFLLSLRAPQYSKEVHTNTPCRSDGRWIRLSFFDFTLCWMSRVQCSLFTVHITLYWRIKFRRHLLNFRSFHFLCSRLWALFSVSSHSVFENVMNQTLLI